jgi:hypothetical protein
MYGLPPDIDLSFFHGKTLQQVCIGANEIILHFDADISITIMSPIECMVPGTALQEYEDYRKAAGVVVVFLQDVVASAKGHADGTLSLEFQGGGRLDVRDDSTHYESYMILNGQDCIVV